MSLRRRSILGLAVLCFFVLISFVPIGVSYAHSTSSTQYPNFMGIYEFSGHNTSTDATNPYIGGRDLTYYWAQLEPTKGQYNWSIIDQDMKPWVDNGKNVILRVSASGWKKWDTNADSAHGTPQWAYDLGVKSVAELDGSVLPEYWNPIFLQNYSDFIQAFANRYDGNPHVTAIQMGIGEGGETKVDSYKNTNMLTLWQGIGYTDQKWWSAVQQMITSYSSSFRQTPTVVMPDKSFIGGTSGYGEDLVVSYAASHNIWLQANDLGASNTNKSSDWNKAPHIEEQLNDTASTGDTLKADLQNGLKLGANYILVFYDDIELSSNQSVLQQVAALANTPTPTPTATDTPTPIPTDTPTDTPTATATDTPTPVPTDTPTPIATAASTPTPASYRYSFEDGTTDGWSYNHADSLANSTTYAFDGTHSLKAVVKTVSTDGYANVSISNSASGSPAMPAVGQTVTAEVYVPSGAPAVKAVVFVKDSAGIKYYTSYDQVSDLPTGKWTQLQFTVPSTISGGVAEYGVRFQFPSSSSSSLNAYIDAVNW